MIDRFNRDSNVKFAPLAWARTIALDATRVLLDQIEASLRYEHHSTEDLIELGRPIPPVREQLRDKIAELEPRLERAEARLKQLGPAPAKGAPAEPPALAEERTQLDSSLAALDAELKQARLLAVRAEQLGQTITERRYAAYARELLRQSWSILDPSFWLKAGEALLADTGNVANLALQWGHTVSEQSSPGRMTAATLMLLIIAGAAVVGLRRWRDWRVEAHPASPLGKALRSLWAMLRTAAFEPILVLVVVQVLELFGLWPAQFDDLGHGLVAAVALGSFGRGVATAVLAPYEPQRRLLSVDDHTARILSQHLVAAARLIAFFAFLDVLQKQVHSPPILIALASVLFAMSILGVMLHLLFDLRASHAAVAEGQVPDRAWIRGLAWLVSGAIAVSLLAGYARLADFITERLLASVIIAGTFYVLLLVSNALLADAFNIDTARGRAVAAHVGVAPRRFALIGAILSGIIRVLLLLLAAVLIISPWEGTTTDIVDAFQGFSLALRIGEATISFKAVLMAFAVLVIGILLTRWARRWLETDILPRTDLEPGLRFSVGIIFGYVGVIAAIALALGALGIDLQKIALVAGALSVGIGFGLQAIVSNFVSGLILLTERPIRVGDWIVAKGEEGFVRRIRVRATEIETFDRASVIVPNSELISGVVKNWTHGNVLGRITIKVGVSYDSDVEQVRRVLLAVADEHPLVLKQPQPYVIFMAFGDSALEFELRCIVRDIQQSLTARSDLNFALLTRFRQAGIDIPFPQRTLHIASGSVMTAQPASSPRDGKDAAGNPLG